MSDIPALLLVFSSQYRTDRRQEEIQLNICAPGAAAQEGFIYWQVLPGFCQVPAVAAPGQVIAALMALSLKSGKEHIQQCFQQHQSMPGCEGTREGQEGTRVTVQLTSHQHFPTAEQASEEHILLSVCSVWSNSSLRISFSSACLP